MVSILIWVKKNQLNKSCHLIKNLTNKVKVSKEIQNDKVDKCLHLWKKLMTEACRLKGNQPIKNIFWIKSLSSQLENHL